MILADSYYLTQAFSQPYEVCITPPLQSRKLRHSSLPTVGSGSARAQSQAARLQHTGMSSLHYTFCWGGSSVSGLQLYPAFWQLS